MVILGSKEETLSKRPKCATEGCANGALVGIGGKFYCGNCAALFTEARNKGLEEEMKNACKKQWWIVVINICPRCQRRILTDKYNEDFVHECDSGNATLDNEDVFVIGDWIDYTGSGVPLSPMRYAGLTNSAFGTRAGIEGVNIYEPTARGHDAKVTRARQHLHWIEFKNGKDRRSN